MIFGEFTADCNEALKVHGRTRMKLIDLTHPITPEMMVFPGTEAPVISQANTFENDGFREKRLSLNSHTGTHVDAPAHMIAGGATLDQFPVDTYYGSAIVYHHERSAGNRITWTMLQPLVSLIESADYLLLATGWDVHWGTEAYFGDFPVLSDEAAWQLGKFSLKGVGLDVISADAMDSRDFQIHRTLLGNNLIIVENLKGIMQIPVRRCAFSCLPLKCLDADGSPVRAVAILD